MENNELFNYVNQGAEYFKSHLKDPNFRKKYSIWIKYNITKAFLEAKGYKVHEEKLLEACKLEVEEENKKER